MKTVWFRVVVLVVISSFVAILVNAVRPNGIDWIIDPYESLNPGVNPWLAEQAAISYEEMMELYYSGTAFLVDARSPDDYHEGHIDLAINIPSTEKENYLDRVFELPPEGIIIIYCEGEDCESSNDIFEFLANNDFTIDNLKIFNPGWYFLVEQGELPIVEGPGR